MAWPSGPGSAAAPTARRSRSRRRCPQSAARPVLVLAQPSHGAQHVVALDIAEADHVPLAVTVSAEIEGQQVVSGFLQLLAEHGICIQRRMRSWADDGGLVAPERRSAVVRRRCRPPQADQAQAVLRFEFDLPAGRIDRTLIHGDDDAGPIRRRRRHHVGQADDEDGEDADDIRRQPPIRAKPRSPPHRQGNSGQLVGGHIEQFKQAKQAGGPVAGERHLRNRHAAAQPDAVDD